MRLLSTNVSTKIIEATPNLKIIANYGAELNNININVINKSIASINQMI